MTTRTIEPYNTRAILKTYLKTPYSRLFVGNLDGADFVISDGFSMMRLPSNHPAFDSRATFPTYPSLGMGLEYLDRYTGKGVDLFGPWQTCLQYTKKAELTNWISAGHGGGSHDARVFRSIDRPIFVQERYVQLLDTEIHTFRCGVTSMDAVAAFEGDEMRLIIMPMYFGEDQKKSFAWVDGMGKG